MVFFYSYFLIYLVHCYIKCIILIKILPKNPKTTNSNYLTIPTQEARKRQKIEDAERKQKERALKLAEFEKWKTPQKRNFVITRKESGEEEVEDTVGIFLSLVNLIIESISKIFYFLRENFKNLQSYNKYVYLHKLYKLTSKPINTKKPPPLLFFSTIIHNTISSTTTTHKPPLTTREKKTTRAASPKSNKRPRKRPPSNSASSH